MQGRPGADGTLDVAVIGSGIAGLGAAWLLAQRHRVTLFEAEGRPGGHSNTVDAPGDNGPVPVDTGFIVYNEPCYPNLTALFRHLGVATQPSDMSLGVSLDGGRTEYAGNDLRGLLAQPTNLLRPRFWAMLRGLLRFYREAPAHRPALEAARLSLGDYLDSAGFGIAFQQDHLLPMAAAIWSAEPARVRDYPAASFIRFCENHGLLKLAGRPQWRTVTGGSRAYVRRLLSAIGEVRLGCPVRAVVPVPGGVVVQPAAGDARRFDQAVIACHADQALALLAAPDTVQARLLGAFRYSRNEAVLHTDPALMPRRRAVWSSWNYIGRRGASGLPCVTYWMNRLQNIADAPPLFVTLNPPAPVPDAQVIRRETYEHPQFDQAALDAQRAFWPIQGAQRLWFCGSWCGAGFHEDALQAGLAVAEALGGVRRPWSVADESGRIHLAAPAPAAASVRLAA